MDEKKSPYETLTVYLVALSTVLLDQFSKFGLVTAIALGHSQPLIDGLLNLTYVQNRGAAFSLWWGHADKLGVVALLVALGVVVYQWKARPRELSLVLALGLYLGGAMGNAVDRVMLGYVRDMFDLQWHGQNVFPIFNVADTAVSIAAGLFLLHSFLTAKRTERLTS